MKIMSLTLKGANVEVSVERLDSDPITEEHLRPSAAILCEVLQDDCENDNEDVDIYKTECVNRCQHCGKFYKNLVTLKAHKRLKHPDNEERVDCKICNKTYSSALSMRMHMRYMHQYQHRCNVCYKTFASATILDQHREACVKCEMPCPTCGKIFNSSMSLKGHVKYKHPKELINSCNVCRRTFNSKRGLSNHMAAIHPGGIKCSGCNKIFYSIGLLQNHFLDKHSDSGARCSLCRKAFSSRTSLSRHLARGHEMAVTFNGDNFWCSVCGSEYENSQDIIQHIFNVHNVKSEPK